MWEKSEGEMGMEHKEQQMGHMGIGMWSEMKMLWDKLEDDAKKTLMQRLLDERIMKEEYWIEHLQHKVETMRMVKTWIEDLEDLD